MNTGEGIGTGQGIAAGKIRVYELAKELGVPNKDLVSKIRALGIEAKNHMSNLEVDDVSRIKRAMDKERQENTVVERVNATVIRRRTKEGGTPARPLTAASAGTTAHVDARPSARRSGEPANGDSSASVEARHANAGRDDLAGDRGDENRQDVDAAEPAPRHDAGHGRHAAGHPAEKHAPVEHHHASAGDPEPAATHARGEEPGGADEPDAANAVDRTDGEPASHATHAGGDRAGDTLAADAAAIGPVVEKKPEPVKYGPTGRVIELPNMRQPIIQVTERAPTNRNVRDLTQKRDISGRDRFGRQAQQGKKKAQIGKKQKSTLITTPAAHKRVIKMEDTVAVGEIAKQMGVKATDVLKKLWGMGLTGITLNSSIDTDAAGLLAGEFGFEIENVAFQEADVFEQDEDKPEDLVLRSPVVTIMGHVDHGKTSLLDAIRNANVAAGEAGGITQHIGAYKVASANGGEVVFLDTPGHEAFTAMRARGAQATDIVVLVVAADDGVMPTTVEAIKHAKEAKVPIIVAVNKIDKPNAKPDQVRQQLSEHGLISEAWGGETIYVDISARNKIGVDKLLEMLALQSEVLELKANPNKLARGVVIEGKLDRNRGPVATVLVQDGTLKHGDTVVAGEQMGKVRAMIDDKGRNVPTAGPATPIEVLGLSGVPGAGENFNAVADEKAAKELVEHRRDSRRKKELAGTGKVSLENILEKIKQGEVKELKVVLKADVAGSAEALKEALTRLSTEQVKVDVILTNVGGITESDVNLAKAGNAIIVGFHVRPAGKAQQLAEQEQVDIKLYDVIYEALDDVKKAMAGLLAPVLREKAMGKAEVRQTFNIPKLGLIAGCMVLDGVIKRSAQLRVVRNAVMVFQGKVTSLRRFKDDVREVGKDFECGIGIENCNDLQPGDVIEAYEVEEFAATL